MLSLPLAAGFAAAIVSTSFISGIFGMAGGMILMGILLAFMPLAPAMVLHGLVQTASSGWRSLAMARGYRLADRGPLCRQLHCRGNHGQRHGA